MATTTNRKTKHLVGLGISGGLAIGKVFVYRDIWQLDHESYEVPANQVDQEFHRVQEAIDQVLKDLAHAVQRIESEVNKPVADIFRAQMAMMRDPVLLDEIYEELSTQRVNSEPIVKQVFRKWQRQFRRISHEPLRQRSEDVADLGRRLLRTLAGTQAHALQDVPKGSVLVAKRLLPSDTVFLSRDSTTAVLVELGGRLSHAALLTREIGIPAVARIPRLLRRVSNGDEMLVNGSEGTIVVNPDPETKQDFLRQLNREKRIWSFARRKSHQEAVTKDGRHVDVLANASCREDVDYAQGNGADGVGLFRLESFYLSKESPPSQQELVSYLHRSLKPMKGRPVTVRLLDAGGDKEPPFLNLPSERNPFLGKRGVRLLFDYPELLQTQLRALLRLARDHKIRILVPMVTLAEEVHRIRKKLHKLAGEMHVSEIPPLGSMIETPAAALSVGDICNYCEFLSIGTNDLTQYVMVAGRENPRVSDYFLESHPAMMRLMKMVVNEAGDTPVSLCGELAGQNEIIGELICMGIKSLSVAPPLVPLVKETIRQHTCE